MSDTTIRPRSIVPATREAMLQLLLSDDELELLGRSGRAHKVSRRDLPAVLASGELGATTVAGTMICAALAGIEVFVTGGIGGVHRGAESTFDISADLEELGRTQVAVVCAGAKAILDIPKTLEVLETKGVPVIGYGTDEFPAFWTRSSGYPVDHRLDTPEAVAALIEMQFRLGLGGVLVGNPIKAEDALDAGFIDENIGKAIADADRQGISRKALTPYLLRRIFELTGGKSLISNIALVENNARVAAAIAVALAARGK